MEDFYHTSPIKVREYFKDISKYCYSNSEFNTCTTYTCNAICCKDNLSREVTAFDILSMSLVSNKLPSQIFTENLTLKLDLLEIPGKAIPKLQLKTPCNFLLNDKCSIHLDKVVGRYVGKPLTCICFPENIYAAHQLGIIVKKTDRRSYKLSKILFNTRKGLSMLKRKTTNKRRKD